MVLKKGNFELYFTPKLQSQQTLHGRPSLQSSFGLQTLRFGTAIAYPI